MTGKELSNLYENIVDGDYRNSRELVQAAIDAGIPVTQILNEGLIAPMGEVGCLFEEGEYFVPEMIVAARAMQSALDVLRPILIDSGVEAIGRIALGSVQGDLHDIGKNLVAMMMEGAGFEVIDLGVDVAPDKFVEAVREGADIIGLSALITTTMGSMGSTIKAVEESGLRDQVRIIIGGAPTTQEYADQIGADGFAGDASQAVTLAKALIESQGN